MTRGVLLGLLVYGYATGVRSSRRIERACGEDVAFRVICAQDAPDHATIARFRREHFADAGTMDDLFAQVLVLAARAGLGKLGLIALDGTKIAANASRDANRSERRLRELARQILAEAEAVDAAEDELYGQARGDELPPELAGPVRRREWIRKALADLEAGRQAAQEGQEAKAEGFRERQRAGQRTGCSPARAAAELASENVARLKAAQQAKIDDWQARNAASLASTGRPLRGCPPVPPDQHCRVKAAEARLARAQQRAADAGRKAGEKAAAGQGAGQVRNITDPDSRLMPARGGGFIQGYNAQADHSAGGLCLVTLVTQDTTEFASFEPMTGKPRPPRTCCGRTPAARCTGCAPGSAPCSPTEHHPGDTETTKQEMSHRSHCHHNSATAPRATGLPPPSQAATSSTTGVGPATGRPCRGRGVAAAMPLIAAPHSCRKSTAPG